MTMGGGSLTDPFQIGPETQSAGYNLASNKNRDGKTASNPRLVAGQKTGVFVIAGQSNAANHAVTPYTPANLSKIDNLDIVGGGVYQGKDPALGCSGSDGSWLFKFADKLITDGEFDRVVIVPCGIASQPISSFLPGGLCQYLLATACRRCAALGFPISGFLWQQGESDGATSQATYTASLQQVIASVRSIGFNAPWFLAKSTWLSGTGQNNTIRAAIDAVVNNVDIFAGPDTDTLTTTPTNYRQAAPSPHFNDAGTTAAANMWAAIIEPKF